MSEHQHDEHCGCGADHDHDHEEQVFLIEDEDGNELEMIMVYAFEMDDQSYAVLIDRNDSEADGVIFRMEADEEGGFLEAIESQEEWDRVVEAYNQLIEAEEKGQQ